MQARILIHVEDPGAANAVMPLLAPLNGRDVEPVLLANGLARGILEARGLTCLPADVGPEEALTRIHPQLILTGTAESPDSPGLRLLDLARQHDTESVSIVDALCNAGLRFKGRGSAPLGHAPDWVLVPDDETALEFQLLGFPEARIVACGNPHFDHIRQERARLTVVGRKEARRRLFPGLDADRTVLVFVSESFHCMRVQDAALLAEYTLPVRSALASRTQIVLDAVLRAVQKLKNRPYMVLRPHPKDKLDTLAEQIPAFDHVAAEGGSLELVHAADLIVGMTSMVLVEAALIGRTTLSVVPRPVEKLSLQTSRLGVTPCAATTSELTELLPSLIEHLPPPVIPKVMFGAVERVMSFLEARLTGQSGSTTFQRNS